jgi:Protein of unknown function (DUF3105)
MRPVLRHVIAVAVAGLTACTDAIEPGGSERPDAAPVRCDAIQELPDQGRSHVPEGAPIDPASRPATSGPHFPSWLDPAGPVIDQPVDQGLEGYAVHNLEHGYVFMYYRHALVPPATFEALASLARSEEKVMLARYDRLPPGVAVALVAWQRLRLCSEAGGADEMTRIARDFIERFRGEAGVAPEPSGP